MTKYITAAAALAPMLMRRASGYGLSTLLSRPMVVWTPSTTSLFRDEFFQHNSPKYEITDASDKWQIAVDVPGVKVDDINIGLEKDGQVLTLSGEMEESKENYKYSSKFYQSFTLDPAIKTEEFSANLKDGVLIVSAPKTEALAEEKVHKIPITQNPHAEDKKEDETADTKEAQTA